MAGTDLLLAGLAAASVVLILVLLRRPALSGAPGARAVGFVAFVALPGLAFLGGVSRHYEQAQTTTWCLSCHGMAAWGESLEIDHPAFLPAAHVQNGRIPAERACFTCHANYTMFGGFDDKARGALHVWRAVTGTVSDPVRLYRPFGNGTCLECHRGGRSYLESPPHAPFLADLESGARTCLMCHNLVHEVDTLDRYERWPDRSS